MISDIPVTGFGDLESEVNDLADLAAVLSTFAERHIDIPARAEKRQMYELDEDNRRAILYAVYQIAHMARQLREKCYEATEAESVERGTIGSEST